MLTAPFCATLLVVSSARTFEPLTVEYKQIADVRSFWENRINEVVERAMSVDGVIAISGIPGFASLRQEVMRSAHNCIKVAPKAQSHTFIDGTIRRTLAATTSGTSMQHQIEHGSDGESCHKFKRVSSAFRRTVGNVADVCMKRLSNTLDIQDAPLLRNGAGRSYRTLEQIIHSGERLEHFHSYQVPEPNADHTQTIDFHVDQGLFIAFVPAMLLHDDGVPAKPILPTGTFSILSEQGEEVEAVFQADSVVILAGDGVNQYLNNRHAGLPVRAPSHAFRMPKGVSGLHRVWYGMMQLPPSDAKNEENGLTFGDIRKLVTATGSSDSGAALALGCSRKLSARELMSTCTSNQIYCWHRCMNYTSTLNPSSCAAQSLGFQCVSQFGQIYREGHGDYFPACTNATEYVTPRPSVAQPSSTCPGWQGLVSDSYYAHRVALVQDETYFLWNVVGNKVEGKMIHKGLVGWLAIGIENQGGGHNGMNGARIVMGLNNPQVGQSIGEYRIDETKTAYRHWKTPLNPSALRDASMTLTACSSSMTFKTGTIYRQSLNVSGGTNRLIWALTHNAYVTEDFGGYAAYHASVTGDRNLRTKFRGHVHLDFVGGREIATTTTPTTTGKPQSTSSSSRSDIFMIFWTIILVATRCS